MDTLLALWLREVDAQVRRRFNDIVEYMISTESDQSDRMNILMKLLLNQNQFLASYTRRLGNVLIAKDPSMTSDVTITFKTVEVSNNALQEAKNKEEHPEI